MNSRVELNGVLQDPGVRRRQDSADCCEEVHRRRSGHGSNPVGRASNTADKQSVQRSLEQSWWG
ncbi:hypothetical protein HOT58_gp01 [Salmonella phage 3A_8767]|uniref:Uncharacterized protein n=1 Tax=Salmonella phage 3A_8767 TaxID=2268591 RepID=A0A2Z5HBS2_9CAUD|nr:hypothetical protein HOT58_gp01 [Salmonella phage 3A_8767]AXC37058.1 hypothetical protein 3a_01 [Salmonella phage 3A_8767]